jgi:ABC-type cobalamin/Fe3+-siderophores transport system ATPase subunit
MTYCSYNWKSVPTEDSKRTGNEEVKGISLIDWVSRVRKEGGICIAAHVDNQQGIRCRFRQTARNTLRLFKEESAENLERDNEVGSNLKDYLFNSGIDGVEIARACDTTHYFWVASDGQTRRCIPTILAFDAHCIEDIQDKNRVTYLKMTGLGFAGLRDALRFPETRIRFPVDLPSPQNPIVCGIQIIGSNDSFFENVTIAFTENLNCLIGARGSGKSTVVEALRYVFGYNRALKELEKLEEQIREMQAANLTNCLNYDPIEFAKMVGLAEFQGLKGKGATIEGSRSEFTDDDIAKIAETNNPFGQDETADVPILAEDGKRLERLLDLQEVEWDDFEEILLNDRPVNEMSPGQRSSAMLPLIALAQETPLLIDQPEDNLDKKLLGGVLANVLAHLKERRQIIVCTHDPNILVGGDAEQVVVMEAVSDRKGKVGNHGSIDNSDIVQTVIDLLEGGKEAFESRQKRYGQHLRQPG